MAYSRPMYSHFDVVYACVWIYAKLIRVLFVSITSGIIFNPGAGANTDPSQTAKDIDPYLKSQFHAEDPGRRKPVLILPNGLSKLEERAHDRN